MPGVEAIPFHTGRQPPPSLAPEQWTRVIRASRRPDEDRTDGSDLHLLRRSPTPGRTATETDTETVHLLTVHRLRGDARVADADLAGVDDLGSTITFCGAWFRPARRIGQTRWRHLLRGARDARRRRGGRYPPRTVHARASQPALMSSRGTRPSTAHARERRDGDGTRRAFPPATRSRPLLADLPKADAGLPVMLGVGGPEDFERREEEVTDDEAAARNAREVPESDDPAASRTLADAGEENRVGDESEEGRVGERSERSERFDASSSSAVARAVGVVRRRAGTDTCTPTRRERGHAGCVRAYATRRKSARRCSSTCATSSGAGSAAGELLRRLAETTSGASVAGAVMYTCESGAVPVTGCEFQRRGARWRWGAGTWREASTFRARAASRFSPVAHVRVGRLSPSERVRVSMSARGYMQRRVRRARRRSSTSGRISSTDSHISSRFTRHPSSLVPLPASLDFPHRRPPRRSPWPRRSSRTPHRRT